MSRAYDNTKRAKQGEETSLRILAATESLVRQKALADLTLAEVAELAEVTVQTVIRKFGGKDGLLEAMANVVRHRIQTQRSQMPGNDFEAALDNLIQHYEAEGDLILRLLSQESTSTFAAHAAAEGRAFHREWVQRTFDDELQPATEAKVDALVVATDLFTWRLLRRDLGRSVAQTREVMMLLIQNAGAK